MKWEKISIPPKAIKKYTPSHEWVFFTEEKAIVGITSFLQKELGEIVFVELPLLGKKVLKGEEICTLESSKAAFDLYAPLSGTIVLVNEDLKQNLKDLQEFPETKGWLFVLELSCPSEEEKLLLQGQLLTEEQYEPYKS